MKSAVDGVCHRSLHDISIATSELSGNSTIR
jgi:hypothetical protein